MSDFLKKRKDNIKHLIGCKIEMIYSKKSADPALLLDSSF